MNAHAVPLLTGRKVLFIFFAFFGTVFAVNAVLLVMAVKTFSGVEAASAYQAGQVYNAEAARAHAQDALHWSLAASALRDPEGRARVAVDLKDASGFALQGRALVAAFHRPTDRREDVIAPLVEQAAGHYGADVAGVAPGQWDLQIDVMEGAERVFRRRARIVLP